MGWDWDWKNIATQAANVAAKLLPLVVGSSEDHAHPEGYMTGDILWYADSGALWAQNTSTHNVGLSFGVRGPDEAHGDYIELGSTLDTNRCKVHKDLKVFQDGQISLAPVVDPHAGADGALKRIITLSVSSLAVGMAAPLFDGSLRVGVYKREDKTYLAKLESDSPVKDWKFDASITSPGGHTVHVSTTDRSSKLNDNTELSVELPAGVEFSSVVENLYVKVTMDVESYEERLKKCRKPEPGLPIANLFRTGR